MSLEEDAPVKDTEGTDAIATLGDLMNVLNESFKVINERMIIMGEEVKAGEVMMSHDKT
jgi:hypothetical protein